MRMNYYYNIVNIQICILLLNASYLFPGDASFGKQVHNAMMLYINSNIQQHMKQLNTYERNMSETIQSISQHISNNEKRDSHNASKDLLSLIQFSHKHNSMIKYWINRTNIHKKKDMNLESFYHKFDIKADMIKKYKQDNDFSFPYTTVHWLPLYNLYGFYRNSIDGEAQKIPESLDIHSSTIYSEGQRLQLYGFFTFLRWVVLNNYYNKRFTNILNEYDSLFPQKKEEQSDFLYLKKELGFTLKQTPWTGYMKPLTIKRWKFDYYSYATIQFLDGLPPDIQKLTLVNNFIDYVTIHSLSSNKNLSKVYNQKINIFKEILDEIRLIAERSKKSKPSTMKPYWDVYSFVCRSYPCISAFKLTKSSDGYEFIEGYEGDRPVQHIFSDHSVFGILYKFKDDINDILNKKMRTIIIPDNKILFSPIFMLQHIIQKEVSGKNQYKDVKVGFKGFLDLYEKSLKE